MSVKSANPRRLWPAVLLVFGFVVAITDAAKAQQVSGPARVREGLQVLFDFRTIDQGQVSNLADSGSPLELQIGQLANARRTDSGLQTTGPAAIRSTTPPTRLMDVLRQSNAITIETWFRPASLQQSGPARIVTLSLNGNERNFTLGQEKDKLEARLRTTRTSTNGMPAIASNAGALSGELVHVVYTRDPAGSARLFVDGELNAEGQVEGDFSNWNLSFHLGVADELSNDRTWQGELRLVGIYSRSLNQDEVRQNFRAGAAAAVITVEESLVVQNSRLFERQVAPLLSKHCLECHDAATRQGGLVLSRQARAVAGGERGPVLTAGRPADSLLWQLVESNEMPHERQPLSDLEKGVLKEWITGGAEWPLAVIDPAVYAHGEQSQNVFVQRLTVAEYISTVSTTLGVDIRKEAIELLPADRRADGFSNTAYNLTVDLSHVEVYGQLAELIADRVDIRALVRRHTRSRELTDENVTKVIQPLGQLLFRGPLSASEVQVFCGVSTSVAAAGGNIDEAVRYILESMLQSPRFLYRIESQRGDGSRWPVSQYELATRLSFILWGTAPDGELLKMAEEGQLDKARVRQLVERMLEDERAVSHSRQFVSEWLNLGRLRNLRPDPVRFPGWSPQLADDMRNETLEFWEDVTWTQRLPLAELMTAQFTWVTPRLARHYRMPQIPAGDDDSLQRVDTTGLPERGGLLTHGSILTVGGDDASTVTRGLFVMHELLRGIVRDPPPCVDTTPIPTKPGLTRRGIAEVRLANQACAGCHTRFEPLSFALERYDGLGTYGEQDEHGNELRQDGQVLIPGQEEPIPYQTTSEFLGLLANSDRVSESLTWKVTQFAVGRPLGPEDYATVTEIHERSRDEGGTWKTLLTAIVLSDLVWLTPTEPVVSDVD